MKEGADVRAKSEQESIALCEERAVSSADWNSVPGDQASIDANRYGQFTPWQRQHLKPPSLVGSVIVLALVEAFMMSLGLLLLARFVGEALSGNGQLFVGLIFLGIFAFFLLAFLPLLLASLKSLHGKVRLRRDLLEGYIAQEDGQVVFAGSSGYVARVSGQPLRSLNGSKSVGLAPGAYHFYYLPRSRRVLSAERQTHLEPDSPQAGLLLALAQAHGFRLEELDANRQGLVSSRQRSRLVRGLLFLFVVMLALVVVSIWQVDLLLQNSPWGFLVLGGFLALLLIATYRRWLDLLEGRVAMVEGFVQRVEESSDDSSSYYYVVGKQRFSVNSAAYVALVPGERYHLYYLPHSKKLVSVEPLL
jgi:hypothetical protein